MIRLRELHVAEDVELTSTSAGEDGGGRRLGRGLRRRRPPRTPAAATTPSRSRSRCPCRDSASSPRAPRPSRRVWEAGDDPQPARQEDRDDHRPARGRPGLLVPAARAEARGCCGRCGDARDRAGDARRRADPGRHGAGGQGRTSPRLRGRGRARQGDPDFRGHAQPSRSARAGGAGTGIDLDGIAVGERTAVAQAAPTTAPAVPGAPDPAAATGTAPSGEAPQSAPGAAVASAAGRSHGREHAARHRHAAGDRRTRDRHPRGTPAAAPAGGALESVSLEFNFTGDFFELADFFHRLKRFVFVDGRQGSRPRPADDDRQRRVRTRTRSSSQRCTATVQGERVPDAEGRGRHRRCHSGRPADHHRRAAAPVSTASDGTAPPTPTATATP